MVLLPAANLILHAQEVALKLLRTIEQPVEVEGQSISVTPSIGIALFPVDGDTPATLIKHADTAMYVAKSRGRANVQFFEPAMASLAYEALVLESQLAQALERGELELLYQPQVRANDGRFVGAEALFALLGDLKERVEKPRAIDGEGLRRGLESVRATFRDVIGIEVGGGASSDGEAEAAVVERVARREAARKSKNWAEADRLRAELLALGVTVEDTPQGPRWWRQ